MLGFEAEQTSKRILEETLPNLFADILTSASSSPSSQPLSILTPNPPTTTYNHLPSALSTSPAQAINKRKECMDSESPPYSQILDSDNKKRKKEIKGGLLPKEAKRVLKDWFFAHMDRPYPTREEKQDLSIATGGVITPAQVSTWFSNARRRGLIHKYKSNQLVVQTQSDPPPIQINNNDTNMIDTPWYQSHHVLLPSNAFHSSSSAATDLVDHNNYNTTFPSLQQQVLSQTLPFDSNLDFL